MSTYLGYTVVFLFIGLFAAYVSKRDLPAGPYGGYAVNYVVAVAGALAGGLFWVALRHYGWGEVEGGTQAGQGPEAMAYAHHNADTTQPGYWIGLFFSTVGAMLALAVYTLIFGREHEA